jgi:hypothetical protein
MGIVSGVTARRSTTGGGKSAAIKSTHGGKREGAGRKRIALPPESLDRIGPRPVHQPLKLARWYAELLSETLDLYVRTGKYVEMYREIRSGATAIRSVMPIDLIIAAANKLKGDDDELEEDADPDEEVRGDDVGDKAVRRNAP